MNNLEIKELENSEVELSGELAAEVFAAYRPKAIASLNQSVTLDGFRPGHASEPALVAKLGEERILIEMAELALGEHYPKLVVEKQLAVVGRPEITITKLATNNPLGFKIKTAIEPKVTLPDLKPLLAAINNEATEEILVEDKEVEAVIEEIKKMRGAETSATPLPPEEELKTRIKENLKLEKEHKARDKKRLSLMAVISEKVEIKVPPILIESELERMLHELKHDLERTGLKFEEYLKHLKKTESDLKSAWRDEALKRVKTGLILREIATANKIEADQTAVEAEVKHLAQHYAEATPERLRAYVSSLLQNEAVWKWLEEQQ